MPVFLVAIFFEIFRIPILASVGLQSYGPYVHVLAIASIFTSASGIALNFKEIKFYVIWLLFSIVSIFVLKYNDPEFENSLRQLLSIMAPALVPFLIISLKIDTQKLNNNIGKLLSAIFYVGTIYVLFEWVLLKNNVFNQCQIASWFTGTYNVQYCNTARQMVTGFYIFKDVSLALIVATFFSFKEWNNKKIVLIRVILLALSLIIVDSLTVLLFIIPLVLLKFYNSVMNNRKFYYLFFILCLFAFQFTPSYERLNSYILHELDLSKFLPQIQGCQLGVGLFIDNQISQVCDSREVHSMFYLFKFGLLPTVFWYSMIAHSGIIALKQFLTRKAIDSLLYFNIAMTMSMIHYSGIEGWGVNFLVVSIYLLASKSSER